ncbi:hypothetical protein SAMN05216404_10129 [Nitrosospira multiformis]|uniref:Uncharacterized protein n=1 Tax=Nitrosospira multiformis TaxID=1231 RepID=A0A1H8AWJ4_9PROT|nr:hypothetical protein SAMN05216404_10129 [Nitrosospira multiformis]
MGVPEGIVPIAGSTAEGAPSIPGNSFYPSFYPSMMLNQQVPIKGARDHDTRSNTYPFARPFLVLPVPPFVNTMPGFYSPGNYMPRGTELHRFNGYVVCNPPNLNGETTAEISAGTTAQRWIKITSTRSPTAPTYPGPCPIYTINGELPQQKSRNTILPSSRTPPGNTR